MKLKEEKILKEIEEEYYVNLFQSSVQDILGTRNGYSVNRQGDINGLNLSLKQLHRIPHQVMELRSLEYLVLYGCALKSIPIEIINLKRLKYVDLEFNEIKKIPVEIVKSRLKISYDKKMGGKVMIIGSNPIVIPPIEIIEKGRNGILSYFDSLNNNKTESLNEVKIIIVGDGGAGKTSLVKRLLNQRFNPSESKTHGIRINRQTFNLLDKEVKVNIWDFGGQEIMHATHQFFLSKRSIYLLVLDARKDSKLEYWLKHIRSFGGDSPIMVVLNKTDQNAGYDVNRLFLKRKYINIIGFFRTSCKRNIGIKTLRKKLYQQILNLELINTVWANNWFLVKTHIESMSNDYISFEHFKSICSKYHIHQEKAIDTLVEFLHDLGISLYFKDFLLEDIHVLKPKWATQGVYKIINSKLLAEGKGYLKLKSLSKILTNKKKGRLLYPKSKYKYIINLMNKFELCYKVNEETILVPDLLSVSEPSINTSNFPDESIDFKISYDFLPRSIFPRLIIKMNKDIDGDYCWRTGVVLNNNHLSTKAIIRLDYEEKQIEFAVYGNLRKDYFPIILYFLRDINSSFENLEVLELIKIPNSLIGLNHENKFINYKHLLTHYVKGYKTIIPEGLDEELKVKELLGVVHPFESSEKEIIKILRKIEFKINSQESFEKELINVFHLKPNLLGVGIDIKQLYRRFIKKK